MSNKKKTKLNVSTSKVTKKVIKKKRRKQTGIPYIQRVLHKYYPKRYPTFASAKERASQIKLLMSGEKYTVVNVLSYERKQRLKKVSNPTLSFELTEPKHYFDLTDYPVLISSADSRIHFRSKMFTYSLTGGETPDYELYFSDFVKHCDSLRRESKSNISYTDDWFVRCSDPYYNSTTKQWESLIYACDVFGSEEDYGFVPNSSEVELKKDIGTKTSKKEETALESKKTGKSDKELDIEMIKAETEKLKQETELLKEQNRSKLFDLHSKGVLTDEELKKLLG